MAQARPGKGDGPPGTVRLLKHAGNDIRKPRLPPGSGSISLPQDLHAKAGISLEVVDLRTLLPYDEQCVPAGVRKCGKIILLHEDMRTGGMLAAVIAEKAFENLDGPIVRVTAPDTPIPFSPPLEESFLPGVHKIADAARQLAAY